MQQKRQDRLEKALASLEAEFRTRLIAALKRCEQGHWGLFGQNDHLQGLPDHMKEKSYQASGAQDLDALGMEIAEIREQLGLTETVFLHARLLEMRGRKHENALGEARLATDWLRELSP